MLANTWHKNKSHRIIYFEDFTSKPKESISCENIFESLGDLINNIIYSVWKFQNFSATHILREIKVGASVALKIAF